MTQDELKLVLETLKWCHGGEPCGTAEAIAVVKKALAQEKTLQALHDENERLGLYKNAYQPEQWVGLTSEEIWDEWIEQSIPERNTHNFVAAFARAIEAKLKQKNGYAEEKK